MDVGTSCAINGNAQKASLSLLSLLRLAT